MLREFQYLFGFFISDSILSVFLYWESPLRVFVDSDGFISRNGKLVPVFMWGVDDLSLSEGSAKINQLCRRELGLEASGRYSATFTGDGPSAFRLSFRDQNYTVGFAPVL